MKTKKYILSTLALFIGLSSFAQSNFGEIGGKIVNDEGLAEGFAEVWVSTGADRVIAESNEEGRYRIKPLSPGTYDVYATTFGFDTTIVQGVKVRSGEITKIKDIMIGAQLVIIEWNIPLIKPDDPTALEVDRAQLKNSPNLQNPAQLIGSLSSDIKVNDNGEIFFRGSRSGSSVYYIDGVKLTGDLANLPGRAYGSVKVYTGGMPAMYGDATGGVVAIETQSYFDLWRKRKAAMSRQQ